MRPTERKGPAHARRRSMVPGAPRSVLRRATGDGVTVADVADVRAAARVARCPKRIVEAWERYEASGTALELEAAQRSTAAWLRPDRVGRPVDVEHALAKARARAEQCGQVLRVFREEGHGLHAIPEACKARVCAACQRRALRRTLDRWRPLFAAPVRPGFVVSFVTVTSTATVSDAAGVSKYVRALGRLVYAMREGVPRFGIAPRSWVAGVRALEIVPRQDGGFSHAHLLVVRRQFVPFGKATANLPPNPTPNDLGFRALLRSLGMGEVCRVDDVTAADEGEGATRVERYMSKVERYMGKVEGDTGAALTWAGREDLQRATRGTRLVEAFGDARGLLGGPDEVTRTRDGQACGAWTLAGIYDPDDPETWHTLPGGVAMDDGEEVTVTRRTYYRADTLEAWDEWADVSALTRGLRMVEGAQGADEVSKRTDTVVPPLESLSPASDGDGSVTASHAGEQLTGVLAPFKEAAMVGGQNQDADKARVPLHDITASALDREETRRLRSSRRRPISSASSSNE